MSQDILNKTSHRNFMEKCAKIYYEMQKNVRKGLVEYRKTCKNTVIL